MQRLLAIIATGLIAISCYAGGQLTGFYYTLTTDPTNPPALKTGTVPQIAGYLEEINIDVPAAGVTGIVWITYQPAITSMATVVVSSNTITGDTTLRPRVYPASTTNVPARYALFGDTVSCTVSNLSNTSNTTYHVFFKMER
jgi:hypothetical protein